MAVEAQPVSVRGGMFNPPVYRAGSGAPLLALHHAGGHGGRFGPEYEALAGHYEVVAPVLPGWDDTPGLDQIDDVHDMTVFLQDLVDALGLTSFNLLGHSLGGMFAAELAAARPDLVRKLVLVAPVGLWMDEAPVTDFFAVLPQDLPGVVFGDPAFAAQVQLPSDPDELAQMLYLQMANFAAAGKFMWPIPDKGLKKRLHRISAPTLILWGDQDRLAPPAYGPLFATKIARSQLATIAGAGHMLPIEKPAEYLAEVRAFLG
jgi:pimeloyl-ACP methyl ester carboxylesterase